MASKDEKPYTISFSQDREDSAWYARDISEVLRPEGRKMLEEYAHIPPEDVIDHISQTRNRAWDLAPYASIGALTWLNPYITLHPAHDTILSRLKSGASIVDCGCFIAPDLRHLAYQGAPTEKMYGFDIEAGFFPIGYDFYNDRSTFKGTFFAADALEDFEKSRLGELKGKMDVLWCPKFLHLFDREHQVQLASRLVSLLRSRAGSMFVGSQNGFPGSMSVSVAPGTFKGQNESFFMGDEDTLRDMWREVALLTGTKWDVDARLLDLRTVGLHVDDGSEYKKRVGYNLQWTATLVEMIDR